MKRRMGWTAVWTMCVLVILSGMSLAAETGGSGDDLMQRGLVAHQQGALEDALVAWKEAARLYETAGNIPGQIQALTKAAHAARAMGHVNQAFQQQELALQLAQKLNDPKWIALTLAELGKTYVVAVVVASVLAPVVCLWRVSPDSRDLLSRFLKACFWSKD